MSFQLEYRVSDRVVVGIGTEADYTFPAGYQPGTGDALATLPDPQIDNVFAFDTAYLCADGQSIGPSPC